MATPASHPATSPLRLLILTPNSLHSPLPTFLHALTSVRPPPTQTTFVGYTGHPPLRLQTKYYSADVAIWCDEVPIDSGGSTAVEKGRKAEEDGTLEEWKSQMLSLEAGEVRGVVGAVVVILTADREANISDREMELVEVVDEVRNLMEDECSGGRELPGVLVLQGAGADSALEKVEDTLRSERGVLGWDVVAWDGEYGVTAEGEQKQEQGQGHARNEYGEKTGLARLREVLEAVPWSAPSDGSDVFLDSDSEAERMGEDGIRVQGFELEREMMDLKMAMRETEEDEAARDTEGKGDGKDDGDDFKDSDWPETKGGDEDVKVEQLQGLMERVIAIREAGAEMGKAERERFARREVERIMKEMG